MPVFGDNLRQARSQKGVTLREAEQDLRINRHYLAALEEESFDNLPPLTYQRGIVRSYATYLGLDQGRVLALFEEARGSRGDVAPVPDASEPVEMPHHWTPNFAVIAFALIAGAVVVTWMYSAYFNTTPTEPSPVALQPTVTPVSGDVIFIPSPTPLIPTPTPTFTPSPTPTETPIPSPTAEPTQSSSNSSQVRDSSGAPQDRVSSEVPTNLEEGQAAIKITALTDIWVQIAADGVLYYEGGLKQGDSTDWVTGESFSVYTNSGVNTMFTNHLGQEFFMDDTPGEVVYQL